MLKMDCCVAWRVRGKAGLLALIGWTLLGPFAHARDAVGVPPAHVVNRVEIRRTTDGIPHLLASNWRDLGYGIGYVQAQDALCTLAEAFVTYEGRRAYFFGADARPARDSTLGRSKNIDLDFFFRAFADEAVLSQYRAQQPPELNESIEGFAAGYNRQLREARRAGGQVQPRACLREAWVREIAPADVYRRLYAAQIAAGYARFIPEIANAQPAGAKTAAVGDPAALRTKLANRVGEQAGLGSNMLAFGGQATGDGGSLLFGNPHWYWGGPDRFYQMHLRIPGRVNVAGVAFLGVPLVMIGFNERVAWSHTVSAARRFGLFDLALDAADPTRYRVDGAVEPMEVRRVSVDVREADGAVHRVTRSFYRTKFGPMINLGAHDAAFGWGSEHALAIRDVNAENFRVFRNFFFWNQARSLDDFIAIQRREAAVPWVNTVAIGGGEGHGGGRVWYADMGAVPNVPDALRETCTTPLAQGFASLDPLTPFLDGSRSACDWRVDAQAVQAGAMPTSAMPSLLRQDYVANMNDSYWLSNAHQTLEGYATVLGGERQALSLRGRLGHQMALELVQGGPRSTLALSGQLMREVLTARAYSAEWFKKDLLDQACVQPEVILPAEAQKPGTQSQTAPASGSPRRVNIANACEVLTRWPNTANAQDRGALLWDAFWGQLQKIPAAELYGVGFSAAAPLTTPRAPKLTGARAAQALAAAVTSMLDKGWALDMPLGTQRFVRSQGQSLSLYGGCNGPGYFTVACNDDGSYPMGPDSSANSYLQVVSFGRRGMRAHTLLAHGQDESAVDNGAGLAPVARYARKDWLRFPFSEEEIARDPQLKRVVLRP